MIRIAARGEFRCLLVMLVSSVGRSNGAIKEGLLIQGVSFFFPGITYVFEFIRSIQLPISKPGAGRPAVSLRLGASSVHIRQSLLFSSFYTSSFFLQIENWDNLGGYLLVFFYEKKNF